MDKEVDLRLFVTCRLCIEELGQYQIVPSVQEQLKYCFDINVALFDGLSQLICQKCKENLNNFYKLKKLYCEKQADLISKYRSGVRVECMPQHDIVSSSQRTETVENTKNVSKKIKRSQISSESNESTKSKKKKNNKTVTRNPIKWDYIGYNKEFVCVLCSSEFSNKESLEKHRILHNKLLAQHSTIFKKTLSVTLEKTDGKSNITGMSNIVAHGSNRLIQHCNSLCYIKYSKAKPQISAEKNSKSNVNKISSVNDRYAETSDTEDETLKIPRRRKRLRVLSRSSTDTVVLESNRDISGNEDYKPLPQLFDNVQHPQVTNDQCINIVDSSDSDTDRNQIDSTYKAKLPVDANEDDNKIIEGIINMCVKAYNKKSESTEKSDKLKHKVLSLGRKIINRPSFNWTGLLRYMEQKNLNIKWVTKAISSTNSKDSDYIRIMMKLCAVDAANDNYGWTPIIARDEVPAIIPERSTATNQITKPTSDIVNIVQPGPDSAVLVPCNRTDHKNKLLNANPVANPKQLPRKITQTTQVHEMRFNTPTVESGAPFHNEEEANLCMPIITSTTSLAVSNVQEKSQSDNIEDLESKAEEKQSNRPRINVKPYSELMSESALNSLRSEFSTGTFNVLQNPVENSINVLPNHTENATSILITPTQNNTNLQWPAQGAPNMVLSNLTPQISIAQPMQLNTFMPQTSSYTASILSPVPLTNRNKEEYGIMDSVDLPNTKTNSPFEYLKRLFLIHNLILILPQDALGRQFLCLIKFKVKFQQEPIDEPVTLCLSLYCYKNTFCFTVKDRNEINLNVNKISANWQWEIVNIFRGDLVNKLLQNAQKHSQETYDYTNQFICLLKSVTFKKMP